MLRLRPHLPLALLATSAALGLGACGGGGGAADGDPASIVPARAVLYLEATVRPDGDLEKNFDTVAGKLAETEDPGAELKALINKEVKEDEPDFDFDKDVDPWLGDRVGIFFTALGGDEPDGAVVAAVSDTDAAQEFISAELRSPGDEGEKPKVVKRTYKDVEYEVDTTENTAGGIVEDYAVLGSDAGIKAAIDAVDGSTLADADEFKEATGEVSDEGLGLGYVKLSQLFSGLGPQGAAARQAFSGVGDTVAFALDVDEDAIRIESAARGGKGEGAAGPGDVFSELPGDAWLAAGSADVGGQFERALEQFGQLGALGGVDLEQALSQIEQQTGLDVRKDLLGWMGDAGIFVSGDSPADVGGALVVRSKDPDTTRDALPKLRRLLGQFGIRTTDAGGDLDAGFGLRIPQVPLPVTMGLKGDRFVVAVTDRALEQATDTSATLGDAQAFKDAAGRLEEGIEPAFFLDMAPVRELIDASGAVEGKEAEKARRVLDHLTTVIAGGTRDGDVVRGEAVTGVE